MICLKLPTRTQDAWGARHGWRYRYSALPRPQSRSSALQRPPIPHTRSSSFTLRAFESFFSGTAISEIFVVPLENTTSVQGSAQFGWQKLPAQGWRQCKNESHTGV